MQTLVFGVHTSKLFHKCLVASLFLVVLGLAVPVAKADSFSFTFNGVTSAGKTVNATAGLNATTGSNTLTITITNNLADIVDVGQGVSGLSFQVVDSSGNVVPITPVTIVAQTGRTIQFDNNITTAVDINGSGNDNLHWGLTTQNPAYLNALGFTQPGGSPPDEVILGPPTSGLTYSSANGSITNSDPHQPFVDQTANFTVTLGTNWQKGYTFSNVSMFFGTTPDSFGDCSGSCTPPAVPEPSTLLLLGSGLAGIVTWRRNKLGMQ